MRAPYPSTPAGGCVSPRPDFRCSMLWWLIWLLKVVLANAGTHTPRPLIPEKWETAFVIKPPVVMGPRFRGDDERLRAKTLRRTGDRHGVARSDAHHGKAALVGAVGAETKQPVDAGKAGWIGQDFGREPLRPLRSRQRRDKRDRVIGQWRGPHRIRAEFG